MRRIISFVLILALIFSCSSFVKLSEQAVYADEVTTEPDNEELPVENELTSKTEVPEETPITESTNTPGPTENTTPKPTDTPVPTDTPEPIIYDLGDVDGSKVIDATDALCVLKNAAKLTVLDAPSLIAADVDKSKIIDAKDALYILQYAAKIIVRFVFTPEENFQVLKDYIKENGVVDEAGVYSISRDYVAENDSDCNVEIDSISYNVSKDLITYKYDVDISDETGNYIYSYIIELGENESNIRLVYDEDSTEMFISWDMSQKIINSQLKITNFFDSNLEKEKNIATLKGSDITTADRDKFKNDNKKYINAMMHSAILSMEDYLKSTLVMNLKDLGFSSYTYTDEELYEVFAPLYGIDIDIADSYKTVKDVIIKNGKRDGDEIIISSGFTGGDSHPNVNGFSSEVYLIYNESEDIIYFSGVIYTEPTGYAASVIIQPFIDSYAYCTVNLYKPGSEYYELLYDVEFIERSYKFKRGAEYNYEYIEPANGNMNEMEQDITSYCIGRLLEDVWYELWSKGNDHQLLSKLGFINAH